MWVLSLEWKTEGVIGSESEGVIRWYAQNNLNQEESVKNEVDGMKKRTDTTNNKKAVLPQGNRAMPQVFFSVEVR